MIIFLCALLAIAFYTLLERKVLSYLQIRKGPNKVSFMGVFQPFADAVKLFQKDMIIPTSSNSMLMIFFCTAGLAVSLLMWGMYPSEFSSEFFSMSILLFLCITAMNVYIILGAGWATNSTYAILGSLRASAQTISYEISLIFTILLPVILITTYQLTTCLHAFPIVLLLLLSTCIWFTTCLAETNRAPFDFAEGESELVSGWNVEYSGGLFAMLFLAEYGSILFLSMLSSTVYMPSHGWFMCSVGGMVIALLFLLARGVFPRYRYDKLMSLCWMSFLPLSLSFLYITCLLFLL